MQKFDRSVEDLGNIVCLEHVNVRIPDQRFATIFYVMGLGLTRDPYLMTGVGNMWINVGRSQFHLPAGKGEVVRGLTGLVIPGRAALLKRLAEVAPMLSGTCFAYEARNDHVAVTCPWGNTIRIHEPSPRFGNMSLGMPYVELNVPTGTAAGIVRFYREYMSTPARVVGEAGSVCAHVMVGQSQELIYRETDVAQPPYDGHHIAIYISDFSGPHKKLLAKGLVSEESDQYQYRFKELVDPETGKHLFTIEHEVRSMTHPLYARPLVNRNPAQSNRAYAPGHEDAAFALPVMG
jgi:hypothetical protein